MYPTTPSKIIASLHCQMVQALGQRPLPSVLFLSLVPVGAWLLIRPLLDPLPPLPAFHAALGFAVFAFLMTAYLVPALGPAFVKANLKGRDLLKTYDTPMSVLLSFSCFPGLLTRVLSYYQSRKPGTRVRMRVHLVLDTVYTICVLGCVCQRLRKSIAAWACGRRVSPPEGTF